MTIYTIKPLDQIVESEWMGDPAWFWEYTFCDYYDEGSGYHHTIETAKVHCEQLWLKRMEADLVTIPNAAMPEQPPTK